MRWLVLVGLLMAGSAQACGIESLKDCFGLKGFYLDGALKYSNLGEPWEVPRTELVRLYDQSGTNFANFTYTAESVEWRKNNPYGVIVVGYDVAPGKRWVIYFEAGHKSSPTTSRDRGEEFAQLGVQWRPWGRR